MADSRIEPVVIHAIYLINCAHRKEREVRANSLAVARSTRCALGDGIGAAGVVLHAGARRASRTAIREAGRQGDRAKRWREPTRARSCWRTRPAPRAARPRLRRARGADRARRWRRPPRRPASTAATCWPRATRSGRADALARSSTSSTPRSASIACAALHVNDSKVAARGRTATCTPRSARARSGSAGLGVFLSEPRFEDLPALLEGAGGPGPRPGRGQDRPAPAPRGARKPPPRPRVNADARPRRPRKRRGSPAR